MDMEFVVVVAVVVDDDARLEVATDDDGREQNRSFRFRPTLSST